MYFETIFAFLEVIKTNIDVSIARFEATGDTRTIDFVISLADTFGFNMTNAAENVDQIKSFKEFVWEWIIITFGRSQRSVT